MAEARDREAWDHTASVLAMLANCHRDPKKGRTFGPKDFHPYERRGRGVPLTQENLGLLKQAFVKEQET